MMSLRCSCVFYRTRHLIILLLHCAVRHVRVGLDHHDLLLPMVLLLLALGLAELLLILGSVLLATRLEQFRMRLIASHSFNKVSFVIFTD